MRKSSAPKLPRSLLKSKKVADATFAVIDLQWAFNEWMRRYIAKPEEFMREFQAIQKFQKSKFKPNYGKECTAYIAKFLTEKVLRAEKRRRR